MALAFLIASLSVPLAFPGNQYLANMNVRCSHHPIKGRFIASSNPSPIATKLIVTR
jgi:hypothetical protein